MTFSMHGTFVLPPHYPDPSVIGKFIDILWPGRAQTVVIVGCVEPAFRGSRVPEGSADQHQRRPGDPCFFHLVTNVAKRAAYQQLVRPADTVCDDRRAVGAIMRGQRTDNACEIVDREMDR